jgi:hypothetical protein
MSLSGIPISEDQCIGDSLDIINGAFVSLDTSVATVSVKVDTKITNPEIRGDGQVLTYFNGRWIASDLPSSGGSETTLVDLIGDIKSVGGTTVYDGIVPSNKGGAGASGQASPAVNGIMKADGNGLVVSAIPGVDYATLAQVNSKITSPSGSQNGQVLTFQGSTQTWVPSSNNTIVPQFYSLSGGSILVQSYYTSPTVTLSTQLANNTYFNLLTAMKNPKGLENPWLNYYTATPKEVTLGFSMAETAAYYLHPFCQSDTIYATISSGISSRITSINGVRYVDTNVIYIGNNSSGFVIAKLPVDSNGNLYMRILQTDPPTYGATVYIVS